MTSRESRLVSLGGYDTHMHLILLVFMVSQAWGSPDSLRARAYCDVQRKHDDFERGQRRADVLLEEAAFADYRLDELGDFLQPREVRRLMDEADRKRERALRIMRQQTEALTAAHARYRPFFLSDPYWIAPRCAEVPLLIPVRPKLARDITA
jgi:hypothetical protein